VCDVSFIGTWSPKKEAVISELDNSSYSVKIWGSQWEKTTTEIVKKSIENRELLGDLYAMAISGSSVNLGILSEARIGSSNGDQITSRTFHIPAAAGFMLHERTDEVLQCFEEGNEMACYGNAEELKEKIKYYVENPSERLRISANGYTRALKDHSLDARATEVLRILHKEGLIA
jgi:spore maturation protein CgeB